MKTPETVRVSSRVPEFPSSSVQGVMHHFLPLSLEYWQPYHGDALNLPLMHHVQFDRWQLDIVMFLFLSVLHVLPRMLKFRFNPKLFATISMASSKGNKVFQLTPEQIALSQARKAKKLQNPTTVHNVLQRPWIQLPCVDFNIKPESQRVKLLTWNVCVFTSFLVMWLISRRCLRNVWYVRTQLMTKSGEFYWPGQRQGSFPR